MLHRHGKAGLSLGFGAGHAINRCTPISSMLRDPLELLQIVTICVI